MIRHALIFAAGIGERMRPLSETTPKPLLEAGGARLIEWHLWKLAEAGVRRVVINTSHLAQQFSAALGDGTRYGLHIRYSHEGPTPLGTGGGMLHALPLLGDAPAFDQPFIAVNGDVWTDFDFALLPSEPDGLAHLVLVDNPPHHPQGDFGVDGHGRLVPFPDSPDAGPRRPLTFAGIGVYRSALFEQWRDPIGDTAGAELTPPRFSTIPLLRARMPSGEVTWQQHHGEWVDVGTPQRLAELDARLRQRE